MAGSGEYVSYNSSKAWHQTKGDYNDNVIVPKSILINIADAIRLKRDGSAGIQTEISMDNTEYIRPSTNGIIPEDFATEINNLPAAAPGTNGGAQIIRLSYDSDSKSYKSTFTPAAALVKSSQIHSINIVTQSPTFGVVIPESLVYLRYSGHSLHSHRNNTSWVSDYVPLTMINPSTSGNGSYTYASYWMPNGDGASNTTTTHWGINKDFLFNSSGALNKSYNSNTSYNIEVKPMTGIMFGANRSISDWSVSAGDSPPEVLIAILGYDSFDGWSV